MTNKSRAQVDKEIHMRRMGIKVPPAGLKAQKQLGGSVAGQRRRTAAQVDKEAHIRRMGGTVNVNTRGRVTTSGFDPLAHPRDRRSGKFRDK